MPYLHIFDLDGTVGDPGYREIRERARPDEIIWIPRLANDWIIRPVIREYVTDLVSRGDHIAIWSASSEPYASFIAESVFPSVPLLFVWTIGETDAERDYFKDLNRVLAAYPQYSKDDLIFYDDLWEQITPNREAGFRCVKSPISPLPLAEGEETFWVKVLSQSCALLTSSSYTSGPPVSPAPSS